MVHLANPIKTFLSHAASIFDRNKTNLGSVMASSDDMYGNKPIYGSFGGEKTIIQTIFSRIAIDASSYPIRYVKVDTDNGMIQKYEKGDIHKIFNEQANIDQTGRAFVQDIIMTMFNNGAVAIVPVDTNVPTGENTVFEIESARVGVIESWYTNHIQVSLYNDRTGLRQSVLVDKKSACIIQNPFYEIMNGNRSTVKRLVRKMNILDVIDNQSGSGRLDIIVQLPYSLKSKNRQDQAKTRKKELDEQLTNSKYGVAYVDAAEKIIQLNRPAENNLMTQIEYLTRMLYSQLGITEQILDGTADEQIMLSYFNRLIEPILAAISLEIERKWLTTNAKTRGYRVTIQKDPLRYVSASKLGEMMEALSRNEIFSSDEVRYILGRLPFGTTRSADLINKQISENSPNSEGVEPGAGPEQNDQLAEED